MSFLWNFVYSDGLSSSCSLGKNWLIWLSSWGLQGPSLAPNSPSLETDDFRCTAQKVPLNSLLLSTSICGQWSCQALGWMSKSLWFRNARGVILLTRHVKPFASPDDIYLHFLLFFCLKKEKKWGIIIIGLLKL